MYDRCCRRPDIEVPEYCCALHRTALAVGEAQIVFTAHIVECEPQELRLPHFENRSEGTTSADRHGA